MKRVLSWFLTLCVLMPGIALADLDPGARDLMAEKTDALAALMAECANDETYMRLMTGSNQAMAQLARKIGCSGWDHRMSGTIYVLKDGAIDAFLSANGMSLKDFSPRVADKLRQTVIGSIPQGIIGAVGVDFVAAASVLRSGTVFLADEAFPDYALVYMRYNLSYDAACTFVKGEDNVVSASLVPVPAGQENALKAMMGIKSLLTSVPGLYEIVYLGR